ncbi:porin family protein, partial [candidate division KSB1 bacterium]|nr:porin family protein [candidate division KSB1 bacterium]NIR72159.1 porin family protein [candidate division KSB1 bacterium]NIS26624.1 porin family protein [candidate division KSB1 bacterium]NIT73392.1 porin family protein [candidate division KSB1 bacterium]NIU27240.1 porin family protein [candidate division KSB1 bacterium]
MKLHFLLTGVLAALCTFANVNLAFSGDWIYGIGFTAGVGRLEGDLRDPQISPLISGHLRVQPIPYLSFSGELGFSPLDSENHQNPAFTDFKTTIVPFELSAIFNFLPFKKVNPFVFAGGGGVYWEATNNGTTLEDGVDSFLKTGGGLEFRLAPTIGVSMGATYRFSLTDAFDQLRQGDENDQVVDVYAGLTYYFN